MNEKVEQRIKNVMSAVFGLSVDQINEESSSDTIELWDSLKHMNLIVALEEEFKVEFTDNETLEMINFLTIKDIVSSK
tara:strand:- start:2211 stop:2444 length:234 start_codon:yes stop_codon:yes gene_type:complete